MTRRSDQWLPTWTTKPARCRPQPAPSCAEAAETPNTPPDVWDRLTVHFVRGDGVHVWCVPRCPDFDRSIALDLLRAQIEPLPTARKPRRRR